MAQAEPAGLIRMNASRVAARLLIEPHLGELLARYPRLRLDLVMDDRLSNIVAEARTPASGWAKAWISTWWPCPSRRR